MIKITIGENEAGQRVDRFLRKYLGNAPLSGIYRIIRKDLKVNGKRVREDRMLEQGDELSLYLAQEQLSAYAAPAEKKVTAKKQFQIVYEDPRVLIVSKPQGLLVHGDRREKRNTLINQVLGYLQGKGEYDPAAEKTFTPAPVNRIDRNTSGLVVFGKTAAAVRQLAEVFREREQIHKFYLAIVCGEVTGELHLTDALVKDPEKNRVSVATDGGQASETHIRPVRSGKRFSLVEAELLTGRTHQIRVHLAKAGVPILGDPKYGNASVNEIGRRCGARGQLLHAWALEFGEMSQPLEELSGKRFEARPPKAFERAEEELIHE